MTNKRILILVFVVVFLTLLAGCLTEPNQRPIITSDPVETATVGVLYTYDVDATDPDEDTLTYFLTKKPSGMFINSATGLIKWTPIPVQIGDNSVIVTVSDGSLNITQPFTIKVSKTTPTPIPVKLTKIVVLPETMSLFVGEGKPIASVIAHYNNESTKEVELTDCTYASITTTDIEVVEVIDGVVTGVAEGTARIVVSYTEDGITVKDGILVTVNPVLLTSIVVDPETMTLFVGDEETITSVTAYYNFGLPVDIALEDCTYALGLATNPNVATVSDAGLVTAIGSGTVRVIVTYQEKTDIILVTVNPVMLGTLAAEDFAWVNRDTGGSGQQIGYATGFGLTDADWTDAQAVVCLYAADDQLLQTNTLNAGHGLTGGPPVAKISSPFDVFGTFDYVADGYWTNVRENEYGRNIAATKVVAIATLNNGKVVTAENTNPTGRP